MSSVMQRNIVAYTQEPERKASWISAWDMAQFSVCALEHPELAGSFIDVGGPEQLNGHDIAERLSKISGQTMPYESIPINEFEDLVSEFIGARAALEIRTLNQWWIDNRNYDPGFVVDIDKVLKQLPVEKLTTFTEWASAYPWK